jgi:hypothetical protein
MLKLIWKIFAPLFLSACSASPRGCPECLEMVVIPAGSFTMGSPASEPGHNSFLIKDPERRVPASTTCRVLHEYRSGGAGFRVAENAGLIANSLASTSALDKRLKILEHSSILHQ